MSSAGEKQYQYVQPERDASGRLIAAGTLKRGIKVGDIVHRDFVMKEAFTGDLLDAELNASTDTPLNFNTALLRYQLVSIGDIKSVTLGMLRDMRPCDSNLLRAAQAELDLAGEVEQ